MARFRSSAPTRRNHAGQPALSMPFLHALATARVACGACAGRRVPRRVARGLRCALGTRPRRKP
ncbi:hypothetical protein BLAT2472_20688 [Burkholderia latens]